MSHFASLPLSTRRVVFAGKVLDAHTKKAIASVVAEIVSMPPDFKHLLEVRAMAAGNAWARMVNRPDRAISARDGCFAFQNLPAGDYEVSLSLPYQGASYGPRTVPFTVGETPENRIRIKEITLAPTAVRGRVVYIADGATAETPLTPLPLARVKMQDGPELGYCNEAGDFFLGCAEVGRRKVMLSAEGYEPAVCDVSIVRGELVELGTVTLSLIRVLNVNEHEKLLRWSMSNDKCL